MAPDSTDAAPATAPATVLRFVCPSCKGRGGSFGISALLVTCELCGGQAFVDQATLDRYGEGQRLRTDRMRRGLSVRLEAERLGISPSQLTRIEAGYEAMPRAGEPEN